MSRENIQGWSDNGRGGQERERSQQPPQSLLQQLLPVMAMAQHSSVNQDTNTITNAGGPSSGDNGDRSGKQGSKGASAGGGMVKLILVDMVARASPAIIGTIRSWVVSRARARAMKLARMVDSMGPGGQLVKRGSVLLQRDLAALASPESDMFDAVLQLASDRPDARFLRRHPKHGIFVIATQDEIMIGDGVFCKCMHPVEDKDEGIMKIEVYSSTKDVSVLRTHLCRIEMEFRQQRDNHLGRSVCYFDEMHQTMDKTSLIFNMYPLETSKSLSNIYGGAVRTVRKRINFFLHNRSWYEARGLPYTLGIMLHGPPGTGKTSLIKGLAHDTGRHILNVKLNAKMSASQLQGLFYSSTIKCVSGGKNSNFNIPTDKRIIVIEDADCNGDESVLSRRAPVVAKGKGKGKGPANKPNMFDNKVIADALDRLAAQPITDDPHIQMTVMSQLQTLKRLKDEYLRGRLNETLAVPGVVPPQGPQNRPIDLAMLLNVLDGVLECPGRIVVMTSNHPELLDPALIRPGRIDCIVHFNFCDAADILEMVNAICDVSIGCEDPRVLAFPEGVWTPAEVTRCIFENIECMDTILLTLTQGPATDLGSGGDEGEEEGEEEERGCRGDLMDLSNCVVVPSLIKPQLIATSQPEPVSSTGTVVRPDTPPERVPGYYLDHEVGISGTTPDKSLFDNKNQVGDPHAHNDAVFSVAAFAKDAPGVECNDAMIIDYTRSNALQL
ncbi:MAG: hypothetical protein WDW38_006644 [Sanguina aurantia]